MCPHSTLLSHHHAIAQVPPLCVSDMACDYYCLPSLLDLSFHRYDCYCQNLQLVRRNNESSTAFAAPDIFPRQQNCTPFPPTSKTDFVVDLQSAELLLDLNWQLLCTGEVELSCA